MSKVEDLSPQTNTPEERLTRYLYIGKEYPVYHPGNWFVHNYYKSEHVTCISELAQNLEKPNIPIEIITKALEQTEYIQNVETLIFALAMCARQTVNEKLRTAAYQNMPKICKNPEHFILFIKFCNQINKEKEDSKNGYGHGWRKSIAKWYNSKTPLELAKCVTQCKGRYGWKHKDIIKLAHYHSDSLQVDFIIKYLMNNLANAKESTSLTEDMNEIVSYIEIIERFKHCDDELEAGVLIEKYNLILDHVPAHLLKSEEVWNSLVQSMNLTTLLTNLQRIHNLGIIKSEAPILAKLTDALTCKEKIIEDKIHPALVYITIKNYENAGKPLTYEKRKAKLNSIKPFPPTNIPNEELLKCLYSTLDIASVNLKTTGLRYVIIANMVKRAMDNATWYNSNIRIQEALAILAYSLRYEENLIIITFNSNDSNIENINKSQTFTEILQLMKKLPVGNVSYITPIDWAVAQNKEVDVFINVVDHVVCRQRLEIQRGGLQYYQEKMNLPNAKMVNCVLSSSTFIKYNYHKNILNMCGFDANMPKIIEAFAKSLF